MRTYSLTPFRYVSSQGVNDEVCARRDSLSRYPNRTNCRNSQPAFKVKYDGGSLQSAKAGADLKLYVNSDSVRIMQGNTEVANILPSSITEVSYGQDVHRRVGAAIGLAVVSLGIGALMALTKSKKHFVGLTWAERRQEGRLCDAV